MIEEKFEILKTSGPPDDAVVDTKCKECGHDFVVHTHILKTKNCEHDLGKSLTVICPQCNVRATTTVKESQIAVLERYANHLRSMINDHIDRTRRNFKLIDAEPDELSLKLECSKCGTEFKVDTRGGLNSQRQQDGLLIKCPCCGVIEEVTKAKAIERLELLEATMKLKRIEEILAGLKNGPETVQA